MFSLIITLISIVLVAVLAVASLNYAGTQWVLGREKAQAATAINQAEQLRGAAAFYLTDHGLSSVRAIEDLVTEGYLTTLPLPPYLLEGAWSIEGNYFIIHTRNTNICDRVSKYGLGFVPDQRPEVPAEGTILGCIQKPTDPDGLFTIYYAIS